MSSLPLWLGVAAVVLGFSGLIRGPFAFVIVFGVTFGFLLCVRAVVRAKAKRKEG